MLDNARRSSRGRPSRCAADAKTTVYDLFFGGFFGLKRIHFKMNIMARHIKKIGLFVNIVFYVSL